MDRRRRLYKNYLSDRSHENKRKVKEVEKSLKYELRRFEVEAMDETAKYLEDTARRHNSKILFWDFNKLRGTSQFRLFPVKNRNVATNSYKERVKERWVEHFEDMLYGYRVRGKDIA